MATNPYHNEAVPMHKRIAAGEKLDGTSLKSQGGNAKPALWKEQDTVKQGLDKYNAEMPKLVAAAKTGNLDNLKAAFGDAAQTCKACHDDFRKKK